MPGLPDPECCFRAFECLASGEDWGEEIAVLADAFPDRLDREVTRLDLSNLLPQEWCRHGRSGNGAASVLMKKSGLVTGARCICSISAN